MSSNKILAGVFVCLALAGAARADAPSLSPLGTPVAPPKERNVIRLPGKTVNAAPEVWERIDGGLPPGAKEGSMARFDGPELWVRNVSEPTLTVFLPASSEATGAAMIVAPGGGFMQLAIDREGYAVARWLNARGIAAFVLKYRLAPLPSDPQQFFRAIGAVYAHAQEMSAQAPAAVLAVDLLPELDAAMRAARQDGSDAVGYVRAHAAQWHLSPHRIGIMGFSAGAVTAVGVAMRADIANRPDVVASIYGLLPDATPIATPAPPAFIAVAADDSLASRASVAIYDSWRSAGAGAELHVFENGGHGFGVIKQAKSSDQWVELFDRWLRERGFATRTAP